MSRTVAQPAEIDWTCSSVTVETTAEQQAVALSSAQTWLWALTGRRYGTFVTVEDRYRSGGGDGRVQPYRGRDMIWRNAIIDGDCRLELKRQPVRAVTEVREFGRVLSPSEYVLEGSTLVRVGATWPTECDDCDPAAIEVDYTWGIPFAGLAASALAEVACEFLAGMTGQSCRLPSRAVSISRQGVTIEMDDAATFAENGLTGLPIADAWIRTVNPNRHQGRSRVVMVDGPRSV